MLLTDATPQAFLGTTNPDRAKAFYADTLGLPLMHEDTFALVFDAGGTPLRVTRAPSFEPLPFTAFGWEVDDVAEAVDALAEAGIAFERFPQLEQDGRGIWTAPDGIRVAWFHDPDGNVLSVSDYREE